MDVFGLHLLYGLLQVSVQVVDGEEEGLILALVAAEDLNHPVDHFGAEGLFDVVAGEEILRSQLFLKNQMI